MEEKLNELLEKAELKLIAYDRVRVEHLYGIKDKSGLPSTKKSEVILK